MRREEYQRAQVVFEALVELAPAARAAQLELACAGDAALRSLVASLLAADERSNEFDTDVARGMPRLLVRELSQTSAPERLGSFRVIRELGRGGMGVVYEAEQELPRRRVALKTLPPWRDDVDAVALFRSEIQTMAQVLHPGIPQVYEVFEAGGLPVLAMELVDGRTIDLVAPELVIRERVRLLELVAAAVEAAHAAGVVHRDLKPANVLVGASGPKVLDFGIAALAVGEAQAAGTRAFAAPEQRERGRADVRSDVYGLGALAAAVLGEPLSRPLAAIVKQATARAPADRYASAQAFADDLRRYREARPVRALAGDARHWIGAHARRLAPAIGVAVVGMALSWLLLQGVDTWLQARAAAQRQAHASGRLLELQVEATGGQVDAGARERAFDAFVRDPAHDGTRALARAWLWRATTLTGEARRRALATAWAHADAPEEATEALAALAPIVAEERRWSTLAALLDRLPPTRAQPERLVLALARWDLTGAQQLLDRDRAPLLAALAGARPVPAGDLGLVLPGGDLMVTRGDRALRVDRAGRTIREWPTMGAELVRDRASLWSSIHPPGETRAITRLDPERDDPPVIVERFDAAIGEMVLADLDGDGVDERYTGLGPYLDSLQVAEPPEAASRPLHASTDALRADIQALAVADMDGDGASDLIVGSYGWHAYDLRVLAGAPDAPRLLGRLRVGPRLLAVLPDPAGAPTVVALGRGHGTPPLEPGADLLVRARLEGSGLVVIDERQGPTRFEAVAVGDLDGDGLPDLVAGSTIGLHLYRQRSDGALLELMIPGMKLVALVELDDDPAAELWVSEREAQGDGTGWLLGVAGGPLPARPLPALVGPTAVPPGVEGFARRSWERAEALVSLGLAADAAETLGLLGDRAGASGAAALARATELTAQSDREAAAELARRLAARPELGPDQRALALEALQAIHAFAALGPHRDALAPAWRATLDRVASRWQALGPDGAVDRALRIVAPDAVTLGGRTPGIELAALAGRGVLLALPLRWDGDVLDLELTLDLHELDWSGTLELQLEAGPWRASLQLQRSGGGPAERHHLTSTCRFGQVASMHDSRFQSGPHVVRMSWLARRGELRCTVDGQAITVAAAATPSSALSLQLVAPASTLGERPLLRARVTQLALGGAGPLAAETDDDRGLSLGDPRALRERLSSGTGWQRALAAAALGEHARIELAGLGDDELAGLLRLDAERWTGPVAAHLGVAEFTRLWSLAWSLGIRYRTAAAQAAALHPALAELPLDDAVAARLALFRAEALLERGRRAEADQLLAVMRERPASAALAWLLSARERRRAGDPAGARQAVAEAIRCSPFPELTIDQVGDDPELGDSLPEGVTAAPALRVAP